MRHPINRVRWSQAFCTLMIAIAAGTSAARAGDKWTGLTPLIDFEPGELHEGFPGGLYPQERNYVSGAHLRAGLQRGLRVRPLDANGKPAADGKIVLLSVGMSNTSQESSAFKQLLRSLVDRNAALVFVNGAQGGQDARRIADPNADYWNIIDQRLQQMGLSPRQVQAVWYKEAIARPTDPFPAHALELRDLSKTVMKIIKSRYPNTMLVYPSSRIYAGYATTNLNPEPFAYESGFSIKWLIADQIDGDPELNYRRGAGEVRAAWMQWGPYLWADGVLGRSDGLVWLREDFANDGTHPSDIGRRKVAELMIDFFSSEPTARLWFLRPGLAALLGDLNGDGEINAFDIEPFVIALFDPDEFQRRFPNVNRVAAGDLNQDGALDAFDIEPFLELLFRN